MGFFAEVLRVLAQHATQAFTLALTVMAPFDFTRGIDQAQSGVPVDVTAMPPAIERRQVMSAGGREGVVRPVENRFEVRVVLFKQQHAHAEDRAGDEFFPQTIGHRPEVFAQYDRLMAMGFKAEQAQQVVHRVIQVGAVGGRRAIGDHPQPLQAHDVINAQAAGVGEIGPEHFDEGAKAVAHQAFRRERGNAPALAGAVENVRWRSHRQ